MFIVNEALSAEKVVAGMIFSVFEPHVLQFGRLGEVWTARAFWRYNRVNVIPLAFGVLFWISVVHSTLSGKAPLLLWMTSALVSVCISTSLVWRIFKTIADRKMLYGPAMLLLQFSVIIAANTGVILLMMYLGVFFRPADRLVAISVAVGIGTLSLFILFGRVKPTSDWALCWYSVSLKSAPQVVQAVSLFTGAAKLDPLSGVLLLCQATSRWWISGGMWRVDRTSTKTQAQFVSASIDLATIIPIAVGGVVSYFVAT